MFRKLVLFLMFCIASPAWLLMRSRYGGRFLRYLFVAWAVIAGVTFALRSVAINRIYANDEFFLIDQWSLAAGVIYPLSGGLWGVQAVFLLLHRLAVGTGDGSPSAPWSTGAFPLLPGTPRLIDVLAFWMAAFVAWAYWFAPVGSFERGSALTIVPIIVAFALLAHSLRWNENKLPYSSPQPKRARSEKQQVTRIAAKPRSQDGLAEVFSRRDPALARITAAPHG